MADYLGQHYRLEPDAKRHVIISMALVDARANDPRIDYVQLALFIDSYLAEWESGAPASRLPTQERDHG